ncbi:MAG: anti-sigma factor antagonist [Planctomycetes bacterium]|nr:anti-sigma factor antagonist [Planctomycetota bacterium]NOG53906.1 STAS domain-containing protein [Planctomycetota bacterium]
MSVTQWSEQILLAELQDEPAFSDELEALIEQIHGSTAKQDVVLNMQGVSFLNSSNIAQLLELQQRMTEKGLTLRLCAVNQRIYSVLQITGLDKFFQIESDTASALAALQLLSPDSTDAEESGRTT